MQYFNQMSLSGQVLWWEIKWTDRKYAFLPHTDRHWQPGFSVLRGTMYVMTSLILLTSCHLASPLRLFFVFLSFFLFFPLSFPLLAANTKKNCVHMSVFHSPIFMRFTLYDIQSLLSFTYCCVHSTFQFYLPCRQYTLPSSREAVLPWHWCVRYPFLQLIVTGGCWWRSWTHNLQSGSSLTSMLMSQYSAWYRSYVSYCCNMFCVIQTSDSSRHVSDHVVRRELRHTNLSGSSSQPQISTQIMVMGVWYRITILISTELGVFFFFLNVLSI